METHHGKGVVKEEKFPNSRKPSHWWVCGEFWNLKGQQNLDGKKKKKKKKQNTGLNATPSGEVAQTLASTTNEQGLDSVEDRPTKRPGKIIKQSC